MYIDTIPNRNSSPAILVRESYRENGKVKKRTLSNISKLPADTIDAIKATLAGGNFEPRDVQSQRQVPPPTSGPIYGVLDVLNQISGVLGINSALGNSRLAKLVQFLVFARIAHQGSRLSAVRWAKDHAVSETLGLSYFDQDDLYKALDWAADHQDKIEDILYRKYVRENKAPLTLVLYDVTSSYLEGEQNELGAYGYNRDGKIGKMQIVIGLLTGPDGEPLSVEVFEGNTGDVDTFDSQIEKVVKRFKIDEIVFVGDRGMIKAKGKDALKAKGDGFKYITALTDPQVRTLIGKNVIQPGLFDEKVVEVVYQGKRLVFRRDDQTQKKEDHRREDKMTKLHKKVAQRNEFVVHSKRADPLAGLNEIKNWSKNHKLSTFVTLELEGTSITIKIDEELKKNDALLDGCYVLESNASADSLSTENLHERYRDLQKVEHDFRTLKTALLEIRPIFVRKGKRTRGHVFVSMLGLKIVRYMRKSLQEDFGSTDDDPYADTVESSLSALSRITLLYYDIAGAKITGIPRPDTRQENILKALKVSLKAPMATCTQ